MKHLSHLSLVVLLSAALTGCSKPDRSQPYEYMRIRTLSPTESGLKYVDISALGLSLVKWKRNYFKIGSVQCQKIVNRYSEKDIKLKLRAWNTVVSEKNDPHYLPAVAVELQCIARLGTDAKCVERANEKARAMKSPSDVLEYLPTALNACNISREVGQARLILIF